MNAGLPLPVSLGILVVLLLTCTALFFLGIHLDHKRTVKSRTTTERVYPE